VSWASRRNRAKWFAKRVDPEYERLNLRCPICGAVMPSSLHRPYHLALEHGWRLSQEFSEVARLSVYKDTGGNRDTPCG